MAWVFTMNVPEIPPSLTIIQSIQWASDRLKPGPFYNARLDSELILAHVVRLDRLNLYLNFDQPLTSSEKHTFSEQKYTIFFAPFGRVFFGLKIDEITLFWIGSAAQRKIVVKESSYSFRNIDLWTQNYTF